MKNLQKRLAELEKRMDGMSKDVDEYLNTMNSNLSVQNSAIRTVSDCLERAKVALHEKINDQRHDMEKEFSEDSFSRSELWERVTDVDYKLDEVEGTIRGYNKRDTDAIDRMWFYINEVRFTAAVNKATLLMFGGPNNDSAKIAMEEAEKQVKKDWDDNTQRTTK